MKKIIISAFILISFFAFPLVSHASYVIHLKNGGQYITDQYWKENGQIKFIISGGIMGIDEDTVRKIEKSKAEPRDVYETKKPALPPAIAEKKPASAVSIPAKEDDSKKDPAIMKEFKQLQKSFDERQNMTIDELNSLKSDLAALWNKIVSYQLEDSFKEEETKIHDMKFFINDLIIIKSKKR